MQPAPTDKLLNPPRGGGKSEEKSGFCSAERCLRSLSRQIPVIPMKFPEEDMVFISKSDRLLGGGQCGSLDRFGGSQRGRSFDYFVEQSRQGLAFALVQRAHEFSDASEMYW